MSKIVVDKSKCIGCGACMAICSEQFTSDDDGLSEVVDSKVSDKAMEAVETCPFQAISVEEDENK